LDVYKTIEEKESGILERLIPVVARYMKRYFQEQKYNVFYPILDRLQRRFSGLILPLLSHATDMVMLEIVPSQYHPFVHMLQGMKARLELLQRHDDWTTFFVEFKKKHKGKKKLISMVETIGDSIWSIETILPPPTASQKRRQKKDKSQTTKTKPPKAARNKRRKKGQLQPISLPTATTDTSIQDQPPSATPFSFGQPSFAVGQPTPIPPPILTMPDKKKVKEIDDSIVSFNEDSTDTIVDHMPPPGETKKKMPRVNLRNKRQINRKKPFFNRPQAMPMKVKEKVPVKRKRFGSESMSEESEKDEDFIPEGLRIIESLKSIDTSRDNENQSFGGTMDSYGEEDKSSNRSFEGTGTIEEREKEGTEDRGEGEVEEEEELGFGEALDNLDDMEDNLSKFVEMEAQEDNEMEDDEEEEEETYDSAEFADFIVPDVPIRVVPKRSSQFFVSKRKYPQ